ncbi:MAG: DUF1109 family protein [Hyphomicrobiales bacterium]|nr:DUF1109 family protein [Hyphomicrobiales bacterium]MBV8662125.1 DUF1109 family protein [Hyphomicrobiales bacterium]
MKTADLINALAADPVAPPIRLGRRVALALALGGAISLVVFMALLGPRHDVMAAMRTMRFNLKFLDTLTFLAPSALLCVRLLRPDARPGALALLFLAPFALLLGGVVAELALVPSEEWGVRMIGHNALHCLTLIPLMSIPPLAAAIAAMRAGAPQYPALSGALAGAASAGIAATIYATNCFDDSPLFVASWYPLATLIVAAVGALAGRRFLAW